MTIMTVHVAKTQLSKLIARAEAGEEIVIARGDKPAVKLVPVKPAPSGQQSTPDPWEHAPDDYINKDDIAAYYRKYPHEWDDMSERVGFAENKQAPFDLKGLPEAVAAGKEFTIMQDGKAVAKTVPLNDKQPRMPGRFAHLRGDMPSGLFDQKLTDDELAAWEGKYSGAGDQ